ncbi:LacI family DNA-binding transcriptional regulator [Carboxylicivirga sp. M1479]|uniref:LacI family DNA-binding transcriptional regulator n=1 Tax=Carboxylicivirga sp. M1479 TaxID=2594476 RepID=UPI001177D71A|nr:LacI family DNA-binding transcriptional regulator [Carboxylicivirga sp. M1479]TRX65940.1 LacI family transcriptional regulator [Carboxylicivirga sp. M1479]
MKASLKTIAEQSGVSKTTVSFVLNGRGDEKNISSETQKRVLDTARQQNYQPNQLARSLSLGRSFTIGFVVPDIANPFFSKMARLVEQYAEEKGYSVMMASTGEKPEKEQLILESFRNRQVDGIILAPTCQASLQFSKHLPLVSFDRVFKSDDQNFVDINNQETAQKLTESLISRGHKHIALFTISSHLPNIQERIKGYKTALQSNNIEFDEDSIFEIRKEHIKADVNAAIHQLLEAKTVSSILFLSNVLTSEGIWSVNKNYPNKKENLQFASFDNLELFDFVEPSVISALQPSDEMAKRSVDMLHSQIENNKTVTNHCLSTTIIER